jgi:anti-sigma B factor antagonist
MVVVRPQMSKVESELRVRPAQVGFRLVLQVEGQLDMATARLLDARTAEALDGGAQDVWLDLTGVDFVDVVGVHALLEIEQMLRVAGRRLAVICAGEPRRAIDLLARGRLELFDSLSDAHLGR